MQKIVQEKQEKIKEFLKLTACSAGPNCENVVDIKIGGTTARHFHCSESCPTCKARVANSCSPDIIYVFTGKD